VQAIPNVPAGHDGKYTSLLLRTTELLSPPANKTNPFCKIIIVSRSPFVESRAVLRGPVKVHSPKVGS